MSKETPNNDELYKALKQSVPDRAEGIVANYKVANELVSGALNGKKKEAAKQAKDQLSLIVQTIVDENAESRAGLVDAFSQELDHIASYFGEVEAKSEVKPAVLPGGPVESVLQSPEKVGSKKAPEIKVEKERPIGFAEPYKVSPLQEVIDQMSDQQKKDVLKQLFEEAQEGKEIPKETEMRLEQLSVVVTALESMKSNIKESRTWGEWWKQAATEFEGTTNAKVLRLSNLIEKMKQLAIPAIVQEGMTMEQVFLKYNMEFGDEVKDKLKSFDETQEFFDKYGRLKDVKNEKDKIAHYTSLIKFLRDRQDYATAQALMQELMDAEFERGREFMDQGLKDSFFDKASAKIDKRMSAAVRKQYRDKGLNNQQIQGIRDEFVALEAQKLENDYIAENLLIGEGDERTEGKKQAMVRDQNAEIWEQYKDMLDPKSEWFNLKDENWDMMVEELIISAPLIILSGGVAGVVTRGLSAGASQLLRGTRLATGFVRLAEGGRLARGVYKAGRVGGKALGLLTEGFFFELTHTGLQGKLLTDQEDWVKRTLWTAATLGVFKGAGKIGAEGAGKFNAFLKNALPKIGDKKLVQLMNHLMIQGHTEVLAMLMIGAIQHMSAGEFDEFYEHFGDQVFHAYVSIGALHIAGKAIVTPMGRIFRPNGGGKKGGVSGEKPADAAETKSVEEAPRATETKAEGPKDSAAAKRSDVERAIETEGSSVIEVRNPTELVDALSLLQSKGFTFEINERGEAIAKKGSTEIYLKEMFDPASFAKGFQESFAKLRTVLSKHPALKRKFEALQKQATDLVKELSKLLEKGPISARVREGFRLRFAALSAALATLMFSNDAKAAGIKDYLKENVWGPVVELKNYIVLGLDITILVVLAWATIGNLSTLGKIFGPIVNVPRARLILSRLNGAARGGRFATEGGIGTRLRNRPGTAPHDILAREAGENLQNALNNLHQGRRIADSIRARRYELGPLAEFAEQMTGTGNRILEILAGDYTGGRIFPTAECNNLLRDFNRMAGDLNNRLANVNNARITLIEIRNLVGYALLVSFSAWWFIAGSSDDDEKRPDVSPEEVTPIAPPPGVTPIGPPSTGGSGSGSSGAPSADPTVAPPPPPSESPAPPSTPPTGGGSTPPPAPSGGIEIEVLGQ